NLFAPKYRRALHWLSAVYNQLGSHSHRNQSVVLFGRKSLIAHLRRYADLFLLIQSKDSPMPVLQYTVANLPCYTAANQSPAVMSESFSFLFVVFELN